ncbi:cytochrome P450 4C1 [Manduca sexta]|uniref:Cytochrome P450 n=1 Tax=Manduca sexta TaxID=7130 RepID=A0A921Z768_MANSE|nr:cytochrome P450 4C1 [Manduca sexta]KAG6452051.1 hypothetical protein O3G_MSEX007446 [Manduca sexta]KAG6452052.1 hypothetical protein O3G_MSEX007446 [Manduca sexta]KAG6452053.1 hypothetical protein O3G_MSEX007446 [Manduca sexta]KAG6452054.1 hypothetical protein O3G_MSEX007446 [Manduca sexta]
MLWPVLLAALLGFFIWKLVVDDKESPLDKLPGPPRKPIIGASLEFLRMDTSAGDLFLKMRCYAKEYGDRYVVKVFKRRILHVYGVKDVEVVLAHSRNITKSKPYTFLQPWLGTGLLLSAGSKWHRRRKILTPAFHFNILKYFCEVIKEKSRDLVERLKKMTGEDVELMPVVSDFTLYTICETAMGTQLDSDKSAAVVKYKNAILQIGDLLLSRLTKVYLHKEFIFRNLPIGRQFEKCLDVVHSFANGVIMDRKKNRVIKNTEDEDALGRKKRLAMLDLLLEAEAGGEIDLEGIQEEVNTFMFEGHDTTAMALTFGLMLLADDERVQKCIYEELQGIFGDSDRQPTMAELAEMKYLEAVIKETLRLYPSVPFIAREITETFKLDDLEVPKGSEVAVHIYDLHRREDLYSEPLVFRPERFLDGELKHPYGFVPFSAGPRNCIGQRFAMIEMKCVLSEICRSFTLQAREKGWRPKLMADMVLRPAEPIYVKFIKR